MPYKLIALDLDDTLLRDDLSISETNKAALRAAAAKGTRIVLASGRNIHSMRRYAEELGAAGPGEYMICTNGAEIMETASGKRLFAQGIEPGLCREVAAAIEARGHSWQVYDSGKILATADNPYSREDMRLTGQPLELIGPGERDGLLGRGQIKFIVPAEPGRIAALHKEMTGLFADRAEILISKPYFLEVLAKGVDKGVGLVRLCELLGIGIGQAMAAGDAMNDLGMLSAAGLGCAPANAVPAAKAAARYVSARTNEGDFVAEIVEKFIL
jgi:Cof subfamily protein (haloacid dehalogenase superfamily)